MGLCPQAGLPSTACGVRTTPEAAHLGKLFAVYVGYNARRPTETRRRAHPRHAPAHRTRPGARQCRGHAPTARPATHYEGWPGGGPGWHTSVVERARTLRHTNTERAEPLRGRGRIWRQANVVCGLLFLAMLIVVLTHSNEERRFLVLLQHLVVMKWTRPCADRLQCATMSSRSGNSWSHRRRVQ